ncbi:Peptidase A1 [Moelleriella libera RCEF 2490]|uniref:Peptidase A1 n=1 Tax=Moelleriella libera RCEF 2490 TaxID=1081109 RepID=A0A162IVI2_9HYPO|nr:Peptidase A1 [Moelleriella libera RCEF 2490]
MHTQSFLALLCAFFSLMTVSVADIQKRSFSVERVANPNFAGHNGPRALIKAYRKFLMPLPDGLMEAMEAQQKKDAAAAAAATKRNVKPSFKYYTRDDAAKRGIIDDVLGGLGLGGGAKKKGAQGAGATPAAGAAPATGAAKGAQNQAGKGKGKGKGAGAGAEQGAGNQQAGNRNNQTTNANGNAGARQGAGNNNGGNTGTNGTNAVGGNRQVGSVAANPEKMEAEFISPIKIGGQTVNVDFDTGSSDLWVFTSALDPQITANHRIYDPTKSTSFRAVEQNSFNISYGDGSGASGTVGMDVVDVGGASFPNQAVELANKVSQQFAQDQTNDGLMGLAFSQINTVKPQKQKTFLDNVKTSLAEPVFSADLRKGAAGTYTFGAIDRSKFQGELSWAPVNNSRGFWQFSSEKFAVNGGQAQPSTSGSQAIADTGTTLILADPAIVQGYYSQVQGAQSTQQGVVFPCNTKMPDLNLDVGGKYMAKVSGNDINFAPVGDGSCFGGLQASPISKFGIYGDIFFKSQYVVFNVGNNTLGMAPHA